MTTEATHEVLPLFPPDVVEITIRVGIVRDGDHLQWEVEVRTPTDGELLSLESTPHLPLSSSGYVIADIDQRLANLLAEYAGPF